MVLESIVYVCMQYCSSESDKVTLYLYHIRCTDSQGVYYKFNLFCMCHAEQTTFAMTVCLGLLELRSLMRYFFCSN